jgi:hypothetical protein
LGLGSGLGLELGLGLGSGLGLVHLNTCHMMPVYSRHRHAFLGIVRPGKECVAGPTTSLYMASWRSCVASQMVSISVQ